MARAAGTHPHSAAATWSAWASRRIGGPRRLVVVLLCAALFAAVAEDVLWTEAEDWIVALDRHLDVVGREMGRDPVIHRIARAISLATGAGLAAALVVASAALTWTGRRHAALVLLLGTAGGWLADVALKLAFRVPRPGRSAEAAFGSGFPSGHTLVTLVAAGLLVWICSRRLPRRLRLALYVLGLGVAVVTGAARIVLHAHWLSDIIGGLAFGSLYLAAFDQLVGDAGADAHPFRRRRRRVRVHAALSLRTPGWLDNCVNEGQDVPSYGGNALRPGT